MDSPRHCPPAAYASRHVDWLLVVGILTWAIVAGVELALNDPKLTALPMGEAIATVLGYLLFLAAFLAIAVDHPRLKHPAVTITGLALQALSVLFLQALEPRSLNQILLIMWSSQLPYFMRLPRAAVLSALTLIVNAAIRFLLEPQQFFWFEPLVYFTFSLFGMVSSRNAIVADQARAELAQRNAELEATQNLLAASAKESERLRIARDLHDTMGHHLTALALQLELLQHQQGDSAKQTQEQARHLVKLLLADVRATVSNLRSEHTLQLQTLFGPLLRSTPQLQIIADIPADLVVDDARVAETLLRATQEIITNTWRHARASQLAVQVRREGNQLLFEASDNGQVAPDWQVGNGLTGLRERVRAIGGDCELQRDAAGHFRVRLELPQVPA